MLTGSSGARKNVNKVTSRPTETITTLARLWYRNYATLTNSFRSALIFVYRLLQKYSDKQKNRRFSFLRRAFTISSAVARNGIEIEIPRRNREIFGSYYLSTAQVRSPVSWLIIVFPAEPPVGSPAGAQQFESAANSRAVSYSLSLAFKSVNHRNSPPRTPTEA